MQILTLTFFKACNYGAFFQSFALQKSVVNSSILDSLPSIFFYADSKRRKKYPFVWFFLLPLFWLKSYLYDNRRFLSKDWKRLKIFHPPKRLDRITDFKGAETIVVGSDQIWNPKFIQNAEKIYFASFANKNVRRISYAASLGSKSWPKDFEKKVIPLLSQFKAISVREESSVAYLSSLGLKNVVSVCDPTILHDEKFYRDNFKYQRSNSNIAFVYRIREAIPSSVKSILGNQYQEINLYNRKTLSSATKWLQFIDNSKFIITDSFHCTVFCILFHKAFLVLPNLTVQKGMNERFSTLLGKTGLEYRSISQMDTTEILLEKLYTPVDWENVDAILEKWRKYSRKWLDEALKS